MEKKHQFTWFKEPCLKVHLILRIMKITVVLLFIGMMNVMANNSYSQSQKVSLNLKNATIEQVLNEIEKKSEFYFLLNQKMIDINRRIDIKANKLSIDKILSAIFNGQNVDYLVYDRQIVLTTKVNSFKLGKKQITITGKVLDSEDGQSLPGVNIQVKGSTEGTITDLDGNFLLNVSDPDATLIFTYIGYLPQTVELNGETDLEIKMVVDTKNIEEVVVIGYGTVKKVNLTGSVSSLSSKEISGKPVSNVVEAMQGSSPGLIIQQSSSEPGSALNIKVRGLGTFGSTDPLILIDGVTGDLKNINPNDIESVSVLKDAASTAIYGSRAANGVILVTTKKGSDQKSTIEYNFMSGVQSPTFLPKIVKSWEFAELRNEALVNSGQNVRYTPKEIADFKANGPNSNWMDEIYKEFAPITSHNLSFTGGNKKVSSFLSLGYLNQASMFEGPDYGLKRYNARMGITYQATERLQITSSVAYARNQIKEHAFWTEWLIEQANRIPSVYSITDQNGDYTLPSGSNSNALARLMEGGQRTYKNDDLTGNLGLNFKINDQFSLNANVGTNMQNNRTHEFRKSIEYAYPGGGDNESSVKEDFSRSTYMNSNFTINYNKSFGDHNIAAMLGGSYEGSSWDGFTGRKIDIPGNNFGYLGNGETVDPSNVTHNVGEWALYSTFGRVNYNYLQKYLVEVNFRTDWSSRFAEGNRAGIFPSFSAAWRVSEESFFEAVKNYVSSLKLRASWGEVGNQDIGYYQYLENVSLNTTAYNFGNTTVVGADFTTANHEIQWETSEIFDAGVDIGFLDNNLNVTFDYFNKTTSGILLVLPIPDLYGGTEPTQNAAIVQNQGWEFSLNYTFLTAKITHNVGFNISDNVNKVIDTKDTEWINGTDINTIIKEDYPLNSYYAYRSDGYFQNQTDVNNGPIPTGLYPKPGDIRYLDKDGDGVIDADNDRFILGNNFPRYTFGFSYRLMWNGFDFSFLIQGVGKRSSWLRGESVEAFHNNNEGPVLDYHLDRWTPNNPDAVYPRLTTGSESSNNALKSDFWIQDAAYARLKNAQVGYSLPASLLTKLHISQIRLYLSGQNLYTLSKMKGGYDPEVVDGSGRTYPLARVVSFGIDVKF